MFDEYFRKAHSKLSNISEFEFLTLTVAATPDIHTNTLNVCTFCWTPLA